MKPITTRTTNHVYAPGGNRDTGNLPCRVEGDVTYSVWELSDMERRLIIDGANIKLAIWHHPIPPTALSISHERPASANDMCEDDRCAELGHTRAFCRRHSHGWGGCTCQPGG